MVEIYELGWMYCSMGLGYGYFGLLLKLWEVVIGWSNVFL